MMQSSELRRALLHWILRWAPGGQKHCVVCGTRVWQFEPYRGGFASQPPLMEALAVVGSDLDNFSCPHCGSHDRERHLFFYMDRLRIFSRMAGARVLHLAPEPHLARRISATGPAEYVKGDLYPDSPDIQKLDILSLPFADDSLDFILANHVLEHVHDDRRALDEIFRVLRPGGMAILQTPFSKSLQATWEDAGITSDKARLQAYGQEDHVRLYGRDVVERFTRSGLSSGYAEHVSVLPDIDAWEQGLNSCEPFFLFEKPGAGDQNSPYRNTVAAAVIDPPGD